MHKLASISMTLGAAILAACSSSQPAKNAAMATPFVMDQWEHVALQRPDLPNTESIGWTGDDRLYRSVTIDYVEGLSKRSYLFSKPNQAMFKPMLALALDRAGLLARTPAEARYALQIDFEEIKANAVGINFAGKSLAIYRIVNRRTGETVFEKPVEAQFLAIYPRLNEDSFAHAYDIAKPGVVAAANAYASFALTEGVFVELINNNENLSDFFGGPIDEVSKATWDDVNQAYIWTTGISLLLGPLDIIRQQLDPTNYVAFAASNENPRDPVIGARQGALSEQGWGSRDGGERARQANMQMLGQSITKFVLDLGQTEGVRFTALLPCTTNNEVQALKRDLMMRGYGYRTEPCNDNLLKERASGLGFTRLK